MRRVLVVLLCAVAGLPGCGADGEFDPAGVVTESIIGGQPDSAHPSVVALSPGCTATLIGAQTLLTAGHCIEPHVNTPSAMSITVGETTYQAASVKLHPEYHFPYYDIGIVRLANAPPITPTAISRVAPSLFSSVTVVGFGRTDRQRSDSGGTKNAAVKTLAFKTSTRLYFVGGFFGYAITCNGDSGGPTFANFGSGEVQVGVHSSGGTLSWNCAVKSEDERVDPHVQWIHDAAEGDVLIDGELGTNPIAGSAQNDDGLPTVDTPITPIDTSQQGSLPTSDTLRDVDGSMMGAAATGCRSVKDISLLGIFILALCYSMVLRMTSSR